MILAFVLWLPVFSLHLRDICKLSLVFTLSSPEVDSHIHSGKKKKKIIA